MRRYELVKFDELSAQTRNALLRAGITTEGQLRDAFASGEIMKVKNFGEKRAKECAQVFGFTLSDRFYAIEDDAEIATLQKQKEEIEAKIKALRENNKAIIVGNVKIEREGDTAEGNEGCTVYKLNNKGWYHIIYCNTLEELEQMAKIEANNLLTAASEAVKKWGKKA